MTMIGADLGAMERLAGRFGTAGAQFVTQTTDIAGEVRTALDEFVTRMKELDGEARNLGTEIDGEMGRLQAKADATVWTGTNRQHHDAAVADIGDRIGQIRQAIESFADEASAVVNGELSSGMEELQTGTKRAGQEASRVSEGFGRSVAQQQSRFDQVMNG
jgi:uncharacterized protein YukE